MAISPVGGGGFAPQAISRQAAPAPKAAVAPAGRDSDGDNDESKGHTVDVRA